METITLGEFNREHIVGNTDCEEGWCGCKGYPIFCECGGLIHAEFMDEDYDNVILWTLCDRCGESE